MLAGGEMLMRCERRQEKLGRRRTWRSRTRSSGWLYLPRRRYGLGGRIWWSTEEVRDAGRLVKCDQAQLGAEARFVLVRWNSSDCWQGGFRFSRLGGTPWRAGR